MQIKGIFIYYTALPKYYLTMWLMPRQIQSVMYSKWTDKDFHLTIICLVTTSDPIQTKTAYPHND